jgi:hypothetical protein
MTEDLDQTTIQPPEPAAPSPDPSRPMAQAPDVLAEQVQTTTVMPNGDRRRWLIAAGVVGVLVIASALAVSLFTGRAANAIVLGYVPTDSIMYGEVRMDLPGDQRANLGGFLSRFPGFADQSTIETKVDEVLDRLVGSATDGQQAFSSDIKPWFAGEVAFSVGALPDPSVATTDPAAMDNARALLLVSVKDAVAAKAWFDSIIADHGITTTTESYGGATITIGDAPDQAAYALLDGKVAVVGDVASVKAAIDTKGASGFGADPSVKTALASTSGDHVGFVYVAVRPLVDWSTKVGGAEVLGTTPNAALTSLVPDWAAFALCVEGDGLVMESLAPKTDASNVGDARTSPVADHVPATAIALAISHDYGKGIQAFIDTYRSMPEFKPTVDSIDQALGVLGGPEAAIGWIGDVGVVVAQTETGVDGGLIVVPTDRAAAERLFTSLRTLVSLGGATAGISLRDETYAGQTITIVDLGDVRDLAALGGVPTDDLGVDLPTGHVELAYAITDQVVVLGSGPGFVQHVLDTTPATSIASNERYKALVGRVGPGSGVGFLDITAIRGLIESAAVRMGGTDLSEYEQEYKPFLEPFDAVITTTSVKDGVSCTKAIVTVK